METATQTLHRLTSYAPGHRWDLPADDPRVVQDLRTNDMDRLPWFFKRYAQELPRLSLPRDLPPTTAPALAVLAGTAEVAPGQAGPGAALPAAAPVRRGSAHLAAAVR